MMYFWTKYWLCTSAQRRVKQTLKKIAYRVFFPLPSFLHEQATHNRNVETLCLTQLLSFDIFLPLTQNLSPQISPINLFVIFHWGQGKQIQAQTVIAEIRYNHSTLLKVLHRNKRNKEPEPLWICMIFLFYFVLLCNKIRLTMVNMPNSTVSRVLEVLPEFCKQKNKIK